MDNALYNGQLIIASEIAENYQKEKEIRMASGHKQLRCPDPECQQPVLRYCHGEIKDAFFAHINNEHCDYAFFDKENEPIMRSIRRTLYDLFKSKGFKVRPEVKVLDHHYAHLLFEMDNANRIVVEIGTQRISANRIEQLTEEYKAKDIAVKWIVIGDANIIIHENKTYFLKRYLLNESNNKDLMVISWDGTDIAQYKVDPNKYNFENRSWVSDAFPATYYEYSPATELTVDGEELTIPGFNKRYLSWLEQKRTALKTAVDQFQDDEKRKREEHQRWLQDQRLYQEQHSMKRDNQIDRSNSIQGRESTNQLKINKTYDQCKQEIMVLIEQQEDEAFDSLGNRWVKCEECGKIDMADNFCYYGGQNHVNLGLCYDCRRKM